MTQQNIQGQAGTVDGNGNLLAYTVPGSAVVTPYSVSVTADGTGASGNFLPCLTFKTQTGSIIARCPASEVASGDAAEVSWFPHVGLSPSILPLPGQILQLWGGASPATDFTTNSTVYVNTNFPTNTSFTKLSSTSALGMWGAFDVIAGSTVPDVIHVNVTFDGSSQEATHVPCAQASALVTAVISTVKGVTGTLEGPLPAGPYTVRVAVSDNVGSTFTVLTSSSCDLTITEFEP